MDIQVWKKILLVMERKLALEVAREGIQPT